MKDLKSMKQKQIKQRKLKQYTLVYSYSHFMHLLLYLNKKHTLKGKHVFSK